MTPSLLLIPDRYKAGKLFSQLPETGLGDFEVIRATPAYRTNESVVLQQMGNNVPRLDFSGGGCPLVPVEQQRTNLLLRSEEFGDAAWTGVGLNAVSANTTNAPNSTITGDTITANGANSTHRIFQAVNGVSGTTYTISIFVKAGTNNFVQIAISGATPFGLTNFANFDLLNGVVGTSGGLQVNNRISLVNGWYRISSQITAIGTGAGQVDFVIIQNASSPRLQSWTSSGSVILWGAMINAASIPLSYTPTAGSTVTYNADQIRLLSAPIGATEGSVSGVFEAGSNVGHIFSLIDGGVDDSIQLDLRSTRAVRLRVSVGSVEELNIESTPLSVGLHAFCVVYSATSFELWIDGVKVAEGVAPVPTVEDAYYGSLNGASSFYNGRLGRFLATTDSNVNASELSTL